MLSSVLSKEYIKYEAIFIEESQIFEFDDSKFVYLCHGRVEVDEEGDKENATNKTRVKNRFVNYIDVDIHNTLMTDKNRVVYCKEQCDCTENNLDTLINTFDLCKSLNYLTEATLWACLIPLTFYKSYLFLTYDEDKATDDEDSLSESSDEDKIVKVACNKCLNVLGDIYFEVKISDMYKSNGLSYEKGLMHPLVFFTDIFSSLKHDIHFVIKNRLLYKKRKDIEEMKIKTYLAHKGISIKFSREMYTNLDHSTKKYLLRRFHTGYQYYRVKRRTLLISSIDMAFFLNYFLFKYKSTEAYLILNKLSSLTESSVTTSKCVNFLYEIISQIKHSLTTPIRHDNVIIYKIKNHLGVKNVDCYIRFIYDIVGIFIRARHCESQVFGGFRY